MSTSLQRAVTLITSDKLKDRTDGLDLLRQVFKSPSVGAKIGDDDEEGKRWSRVFTALFSCVQMDRDACFKKGSWQDATQVALRRIKESSGALQWLVETNIQHLPIVVVNQILQHIAQMIEYRGALFEPLSLSYLQALRNILEYEPHVEHFDEQRWQYVTRLCFNIVLRDHLKASFHAGDAGDAEDDEDARGVGSSTTRGKRKASGDQKPKRQATREEIELLLSLEYLMAASTAPLLGSAKLGVLVLAKYARVLETFSGESLAQCHALSGINHVLAALEHNERLVQTQFAQQVWPCLLALWPAKLRPLKEQLVICLRMLVPFVACAGFDPLSGTPTAALEVAHGLLGALQPLALGEAEQRFGLKPLPSSSFDFAFDSRPRSELGVFEYSILRSGRACVNVDALSWSTLELAADIIAVLAGTQSGRAGPEAGTSSETVAPSATDGASRTRSSTLVSSTAMTQRAAKRRRTQGATTETLDALTSLLEGIELKSDALLETAQAARVWRLQVLLFLILRHWRTLAAGVRSQILDALGTLLQIADDDVQYWTLLATAAAAACAATSSDRSAALWAQVWPVACRRSFLPSTSRAAAHAAHAVLRADLVPRAVALAEVQNLLGDIDVQGPPFPTDAVCGFLCAALALACSDPTLAARKLEEKVLGWLQAVWSPLNGSTKGFKRARVEEHDPCDVALLLSRVCRLHREPAFNRGRSMLPTCATVTALTREREGSTIRDYLLRCDLTGAGEGGAGPNVASHSQSMTSAALELDESTPLRGLESLELRCLKFLERALADFELEWTQPEEGSGMVNLITSGKLEQTRRSLDFTVLVLLFNATLALNYISAPPQLGFSASRLFLAVLGVCSQERWSSLDRAEILRGIEPLLPLTCTAQTHGVAAGQHGLVQAGRQSGVRHEVLRAQQSTANAHSQAASDVPHPDAFLSLVWRRAELQEATLDRLRSVHEVATSSDSHVEFKGRSGASQEETDTWAPRARKESTGFEGADTDSQALSACVSICLGGLADIPRLQGRSRGEKAKARISQPSSDAWLGHSAAPLVPGTTDQALAALIIDGPIERLEATLSVLARLYAQGRLHLSQRNISDILERLGDDVLPDYQYQHSEHSQLIAIDLLDGTMHAWTDEAAHSVELAQKADRFCTFLVKQLSKQRAAMQSQWRVRLRLASFIERLLVRSTGGTGTGGARTAPWQSKRAVLKPESLLGMLLELVKDDDMRVRFAAASTCGRLFELVGSAQLAVTASSLYDQLRELLPTATDDASLMMARLLTLGNVLVASAPVRHLALYHLVELVFVTSEYHAATSAILRCVAARLGFDETRDLWHHFAGSVSWSMAQSDYDVLKAPYHILGYTSRRQCLDHTFRPVASMLLAQPNLLQDFEKLASFLKISSAQAMRECLPFIVGVDLGLSGEDAASRGALSSAALYGERWTIVNQHLLERWHCTGTPQVMSDLLSKLADQVVVTLLRNFYEPVEASNETKRGTGATGGSSARIADAVLRSIGSADAACATELKHLMFDIGHAETASLHEPPRPMCNALGTYHALRIFARGPVAIFSVSSSYHIVGQMLELVFRERLVNDQLRHLQALKLFLALSSKAVCTSAVVLRALIDGAVTLLGYLDLVDAAVGLLDWAFRALSALPSAPLELAALLVSVVSQTETHASSNDSSARRAGELLYAWLNERLVPRLLDGADPRFFRAALVVWPRPHSAQMSEHLGLVTLDELIDAISAMPQRPVNTCTLQRVASALRQANAAQRRRFSAGAVWQILERQKSGTGVRIGSLATQQGDAAARAFADIIFVCEGQLHTPSYDALPASADPASSYTLEPHDNVGAVDDPLVSLRAHLTLRVVDALRGPDGLRRSGLVTQRLRAILALMPGDISHCSPPTQLARQELELLTAFPSPALVPKERTLESLSSIDALRRAESFDTWVCWMASFVCDFQAGHGAPSFFGQLSTLVAADARLAGETLPVLLHALLHSSELDVDGTGPTSRGAVEPEGDAVELAFKLYFESLLRSDAVDKKVWAAVIGVILHMRRFVRDRDLPLSGDQWLRVDLLLLARRARDCKLFASSLLFIELAREHRSDAAGSAEQDTSHLLYSIYSNIEDPDGFYSVKNSDVRASLVHRLHHEQRWERAFSMHAADYESELAGAPRTLDLREKKAPATLGVGRALHELGFNRLAGLLGQSSLLDATPSAGTDIAYDVAWRSGSWDLPASGNAQPGTSQGLFSALRALNRERDSRSIASAVSGALSLELRGLSDVGTEANAEARRVARELLSLREVDLWHSKFVVPGSSEQSLRAARTAWTALPSTFEFQDIERILSVRHLLLSSQRRQCSADDIGSGLGDALSTQLASLEQLTLLRLSEAAREQDRGQTAMGAVTLAEPLSEVFAGTADLEKRARALVTEEFASVLWAQGEHAIAIQALEEHIQLDAPNGIEAEVQRAMVLAKLGQWRATARSDQPLAIHDRYFMPAWQYIEHSDVSSEERGKVAYLYAQFADEQFRESKSSEEARKLRGFVSDRRDEIAAIRSELFSEKDKMRQRLLRHQETTAAKLLAMDQDQLDVCLSSCQLFAEQATVMYAVALSESDRHDDSITRLVSLWFEHSDDETFNSTHRPDLLSIPSRKFIPLTHQISSRLAKSGPSARSTPSSNAPTSEAFQAIISALMLKMAVDHPFHTFYALFSLRKGAVDEREKVSSGSGGRVSQLVESAPQARGAAAEEIIHQLRTQPRLASRLKTLEKLGDACVEWAELKLQVAFPQYHTEGRIRSGRLAIPSRPALQIFALRNVPVPVITSRLDIDPTCKYESFVSVASYAPHFTTAGGIHVPKITDCIGSDGKQYKQLYKNDDDLRQDAIMQQVFGLCNGLLEKDRAARRRNLRVRTYAVVPLGPQCGLLEFVPDTEPIGTPIITTHAEFQPAGQYDAAEARSRLSKLYRSPPAARIQAFKQVCKEFAPTFRFYFLDRHKEPLSWLSTRLNYTRSVATTSIVGHMLGIGDRHVSNILMDNGTGEVVHIDFGVAFEQGRLLPVPELVPFRLTRDIIDGMGMAGTEGVYRRCCEETLRVLREGADVVKTVLEVFRYDPLWAWSSNPVKVLKAQGAGDDNVAAMNRAAKGDARRSRPSARASGEVEDTGDGARDTAELLAERAISSVMAKLSASLSVEYTVNDLIQQATNPDNLGTIFHGWQPAL